MERKKNSIFNLDLNINTGSNIRKKLINLGLKRDGSADKSQTSRSPRVPYTDHSKSPREIPNNFRKIFGVSKSPISKPQTRSKDPTRIKKFLNNLLQTTLTEKIFRHDLYKEMTMIDISGWGRDKDKHKCLEAELKCLKVGKTIPEFVSKIIEEIAIADGICTWKDVEKSRKNGNKELRLNKLCEWFTIGRVKKMSIEKADSQVYSALCLLLHAFGDQLEKAGTHTENLLVFFANPGLVVKTIKTLPELVKSLSIPKETVQKSFVNYCKVTTNSNTEGIKKIMELLEEIYKVYNIYPQEFESKIPEEKIIPEISIEEGKFDWKFHRGSILSFDKKENFPEFENFSPISPRIPRQKSSMQRKNVDVLQSYDQNSDISIHSSKSQDKILVNKEYLQNKESKNVLLSRFIKKSTQKEEGGILETNFSDNPDISDNENPKDYSRSLTPVLKSFNVDKMLLKSRFYKRVESLIDDFFHTKIDFGPLELEKYKKDKDYSWKKLDSINKHMKDWLGECIEYLDKSEIYINCTDEVMKMKRKAVQQKLNEPGYVDTVVFRILAEFEKIAVQREDF
ncbi:hypothetical protein SteCoe_33329 [Stentor coeruleus]|uniref:Uncharacterized protein n=1 Tax=Stentor coeruleus TaxID=5963 RepID=A0A1R2AX11_9CILI|nr:hypothetical protein SteCoe_33329 [Stentor coeruleus]